MEVPGEYEPPFPLFTKWSKKAIVHDNTTLTISKVTIVSPETGPMIGENRLSYFFFVARFTTQIQMITMYYVHKI
jgi:hypothetical protein